MKPISYWTVFFHPSGLGKRFVRKIFRVTHSDPVLVYFYLDHHDIPSSRSVNIINLKNHQILELIRLVGKYLEANQIRPEHAEILLDLLNAELLARLNRKKQKVNL